jgi:hypothetical protein
MDVSPDLPDTAELEELRAYKAQVEANRAKLAQEAIERANQKAIRSERRKSRENLKPLPQSSGLSFGLEEGFDADEEVNPNSGVPFGSLVPIDDAIAVDTTPQTRQQVSERVVGFLGNVITDVARQSGAMLDAPAHGQIAGAIVRGNLNEEARRASTGTATPTPPKKTRGKGKKRGPNDPDYDPETDGENSAKKNKTPKTPPDPLTQRLSQIRGLMVSKHERLKKIIDDENKRGKTYNKVRQSYIKTAKEQKSQEMKETHDQLLSMLNSPVPGKDDFKVHMELASIKWNYDNEKPSKKNYLKDSEGKRIPLPESEWDDSTKPEYQFDGYKDTIIYTDALHEFCNFLRATADFLDTKNVKADVLKQEVKDLNAEYKIKMAQKVRQDEEKWTLSYGFKLDSDSDEDA